MATEKKVLLVKNITREGAGIVGKIVAERGLGYDEVDLSAGGALPPPKSYSAIFVFGGPDSANDATEKMKRELAFVQSAVSSGIPYFGICLGMQVFCKAMGGTVRRNEVPEIGFRAPDGDFFSIELTSEGKTDPIFSGLGTKLKIFHLHGEMGELAAGMKLLAAGRYCKNQAVKFGKCAYGFQGHLELTEEIFEVWLAQDADLKKMDGKKLRLDYQAVQKEYGTCGRKLIENFLSIAGL